MAAAGQGATGQRSQPHHLLRAACHRPRQFRPVETPYSDGGAQRRRRLVGTAQAGFGRFRLAHRVGAGQRPGSTPETGMSVFACCFPRVIRASGSIILESSAGRRVREVPVPVNTSGRTPRMAAYRPARREPQKCTNPALQPLNRQTIPGGLRLVLTHLGGSAGVTVQRIE